MRLFDRIWDAVAARVNDWASAQRGLAEAEAMRDEAIRGYADALDQRDDWMQRAAELDAMLTQAARDIAQLRLEAERIPDSVTLHNAN